MMSALSLAALVLISASIRDEIYADIDDFMSHAGFRTGDISSQGGGEQDIDIPPDVFSAAPSRL